MDTSNCHPQHRGNQPLKGSHRERRDARCTAVLSRHSTPTAFSGFTYHCRLFHMKASSQEWRKKGFLLPRLSPAYGLRWGWILPAFHTDGLRMFPSCAFPLLDEQLIFYSLLSMPVWGGCFFSHLRLFLGRSMLPSAMPLCCNYLP